MTTDYTSKAIIDVAACSWIINRKDDGRVAYTVFSGEDEDVMVQGIVATEDEAKDAIIAAITKFIKEGV